MDFKIYPEAGHGFASALNDPATFRPDDAKDADARTDAFFKRVLAVKKVTAKKTTTSKKTTKPAPKPTPKKPSKPGASANGRHLRRRYAWLSCTSPR